MTVKERLGKKDCKVFESCYDEILIDSDHFQSLLRDRKKRITDPRTHGPMDGRTNPLIEMLGRI